MFGRFQEDLRRRNAPSAQNNKVLVHPQIVDIIIRHQETLVNFKKQEEPILKLKKRANKKHKQENNTEKDEDHDEENDQSDLENDEMDNQIETKDTDQKDQEGDGQNTETEDEEETEEIDEGAAKPKHRKLPQCLKASVKYNFQEQTVVLCFSDEHFEWSLVSITGLYNFNQIQIRELDFEEITGNDFVYNMARQDDLKAKVFKLNVKKIDRHVLMKQFTVNINYLFLEDVDMNYFSSKYTFDVPYFRKETELKFKFLGHYHADHRITRLYNYKFKQNPALSSDDLRLLIELDRHQRENLTNRVSGSSTQMIKYALNVEDLSSQDEIKEFTVKNVKLSGMMDNYSFHIKRNKVPPNFEEMSLCLVPMHKYRDGWINCEDDCIFSKFERYEGGKIYFEKKFPVGRGGIQRVIDLENTYFVRFIPNRITYRACFQALDDITQQLLRDFFDNFENEPTQCTRESNLRLNNFEWFNEQISTNQEQMNAIKNIVNCTAYPFPYVVFGPPGTGKTSCIVECIAQILKLKPLSRIMVTAQSNSACDEVGVRLLKYISQNKIYRYYSPSLLNPSNGETSAVLRRTSNLRNGRKSQYPTKEEFCHFNVMIVTLMSCSRLVQLATENMNRNFDYIFVDECAAATEPEAMVPIVGLGTDFQEITTNIVLLGDHKQLGPVISSDIAARLGLGVSLMERIMSKRRYRINPLDMSYDTNYVTQLLDNFRSHPAILQFSNVLFYDSKLRAKLGEPEKSFGTHWKYLNNKKFPVLFHCVKTPSKIIRGGTSSYNDGEIKMVRFYVDLLLRIGVGNEKVSEEDIGIVSPYKAQLNRLRGNLKHHRGVEIGTAEYYQGREKKIMIISTVKSRSNIGFVKSEKRLNVCITRAKSLLIIVGNGDTLQQNSLWNSFMHFCKANDACCGDKFELNKLTDKERRILSELNKVFDDLSLDDQTDTQPAIERAEDLKAIEERMKKLERLLQRM